MPKSSLVVTGGFAVFPNFPSPIPRPLSLILPIQHIVALGFPLVKRVLFRLRLESHAVTASHTTASWN